MKFAVTGGAGFIGSHLVKYLLKNDHDISVIDNLTRGKMENLKGVEKDIDFFKIDITNYSELKNILKQIDGVFHEAALTSVPESFTKTDEYRRVNIDGSENIFKLSREFGFKVVFASSASVYGNTIIIPIEENFKRKPINPYGITKLDAEYLAEKYSKIESQIIGLRYFNVYGKGQTQDYAGVITKFLKSLSKGKPPIIFGDGSQVRDFISVYDVCRANLLSMKSNVKSGFFNIGTGITTSIKNLADLMIRLSDNSLKPEYKNLPKGDIQLSQANIFLSKNCFSWEPKISLEEGLRELITSN